MASLDLTEPRRRRRIASLTAAETGAALRRAFRLDQRDRMPGLVKLQIPANIKQVSTEFLSALLGPSARHFGTADRLQTKYRFEASPEMMQKITEGLQSLAAKAAPRMAMAPVRAITPRSYFHPSTTGYPQPAPPRPARRYGL
jgi:hypothetical protein